MERDAGRRPGYTGRVPRGASEGVLGVQVQAHEATLNMLNQAASATQNAELRTLVQNAIPAVQQHLDRARQILSGLGS